MSEKPVPLLAIVRVFMGLGAFSFGGGLTGWAYRIVVHSRKWMTDRDFVVALGLSQALPGGNITNLAVYVGNLLRGVPGGLIAAGSLLLVPFFAVLLLQSFYADIAHYWWAREAMNGVVAAAIGIVLFAGWKTATRASSSLTSFAVLLVTFIAIAVLELPFIPVVLCMAPISVALAWPRKPRNA